MDSRKVTMPVLPGECALETHPRKLLISFNSLGGVPKETPGTAKVTKKKTIVYTAFSDILTWKPVSDHSSRYHTSAMPLQRHWCRGTCFLLPRQKLFLKRCDSCTPEVNRP